MDDKRLLGQVRKAVEKYNMINEGDKIAVGLSGGKDSLSLLYALSKLRNFYPLSFELYAVTVTMGFEGFDTETIQGICKFLNVPLHIEETLIGLVIFNERKEANPCSLCANMRRGAVNGTAKKIGCNKVALAHHKDDVVETVLLSLFYEGRINCFSPVTYLNKKDIHIIRPLIYAEEKEIKAFIKNSFLTPVHNPCPADGNTTRQDIKELLRYLQKDKKDIKQNIYGALQRSGLFGW